MKLIPADVSVYLEVDGRPAPQGSKKAFVGKRGKVAMVEVSEYVKPWRDRVQAAARAWMDRAPDPPLLDGPLSVDMVFSLARPKGHYGTGRNAGVLKPWAAAAWPTGAPDLSKLARSTEDALTDAGLWRDDSRVVAYGRLEKRYVAEETGLFDPYARHAPGAVILIRRLEAGR